MGDSVAIVSFVSSLLVGVDSPKTCYSNIQTNNIDKIFIHGFMVLLQKALRWRFLSDYQISDQIARRVWRGALEVRGQAKLL